MEIRIARYIGNGLARCDGEVFGCDGRLLRINDPLALEPDGTLTPVWPFTRIMSGPFDVRTHGYRGYLASQHWHETRRRVLRRHGMLCRCGSLATQCHHLSYDNLGHEFFMDLAPLCATCHARVHGK